MLRCAKYQNLVCWLNFLCQLCSLAVELELLEQEVVGSVGSHLRLHYTLSLYQFTVFRQVFSMINETSLDSILKLILVFYINIKK